MESVSNLTSKPSYLFVISVLLILGALHTPHFPILVFVAFVPLYALVDRANGMRSTYMIFIAVLIMGWIMSIYVRGFAIKAILLYAVVMYGTLWAYALSFIFTEGRLKKFTFVIFMLGAEYILLKAHPTDAVFLADLLAHKPEWTQWNNYTGYLGSSFWVLLVNLIFYLGIFKSKNRKVWVLMAGVLVVLLPIVLSHFFNNSAITKIDMVQLYKGETLALKNTYTQHGELICRTAAWISVLIVIFTGVKSMIKKTV